MSTIPANQPAPAADLPAPEPRGRDRILTQARALFLARGYLDVSMREIAAAADVRKATIYHHFRDKEALFTDIVLAEIATSQQRMSETIAAINGFSETLEALATQQFTNARSGAWPGTTANTFPSTPTRRSMPRSGSCSVSIGASSRTPMTLVKSPGSIQTSPPRVSTRQSSPGPGAFP